MSPPTPDYVAALDLGSTQDYSALVVLQRRWEAVRGTGNVLPHFLVRYIRRWPLLTSYVQVVADTVAVVRTPPLRYPPLAVDQTGVGNPVVDMLREARPAAVLHPVVITAGHNTTEGQDGSLHVPKKELVSALQVALQSRRLKIAALPERDLLAKELAAFRVKITASANESFECLVAGTMIETVTGPVPIEHVRTGDLVLTRRGYKRVLWSGQTRRVRNLVSVPLSNGQRLVGTGDHLLWTTRYGWLSLQHVCHHDDLLSLEHSPCLERPRKPKQLSSTESSTASRRARDTTHELVSVRKPCCCTGRCGRITTAPSPPAMRCTTRTGTLRTTTSPTWSALPVVSTPSGTTQAAGGCAPALCVERCLVARGTARCFAPTSVPTGGASRGNSPARSAELASARTAMGGTAPSSGSVRTRAGKHTAIDSAGLPGSVPGAERCSPPNTGSPSSVRVAAPPVTVCGTSTVPVYDLVVEDCHEFFANGVLVHNSWRERDHDDLVLAVALGVLVGSLPVPHPAAAGGARLAPAAARLMPSEAAGLPPPDAF